jgi:uncharacterized membrane protein YhaH (DUF805 family)
MLNTGKRNTFSSSLWRHVVNFWSIVLYVTILSDFLLDHKLTKILGPVSALYVASLVVYSAEKEFERWHDYHTSRHPGEIYVITWTVLIFLLLVLEIIYHSTYVIPEVVFSTYVVVLGVLAITKKSREEYNKKRKKIK